MHLFHYPLTVPLLGFACLPLGQVESFLVLMQREVAHKFLQSHEQRFERICKRL